MIEMYSKELSIPERKSSKGNQLKFERDGIWYKADYLGYEGLAEYVISHLLAYSSLKEEEFITYDLEELRYRGTVFRGCRSRDFAGTWQLITLERLLEQHCGVGMSRIVYGISDHTERLRTLTEQVERITGLSFGAYISKILTIDALFLNEDRHSHNLAVMMNERREFRLCPIFDNGAGLLSDTTLDYPMNQDPLQLISTAKPKTFCETFEEQLDIAESLYGQQIRFHFDYSIIKKVLDEAGLYEKSVRERVMEIILQQRRKYDYLFK